MTGRFLLGLAALATTAGAQAPATVGTGEIDVAHYELRISLPDTGATIRGVATLQLRKARGATRLPVDILLAVDSVSVDGRRVKFAGRSGGIVVPLDAGADTARVVVRYHGAPADGLIISRDAQGRWQAFGDNWPTRGRHWLPLVDAPSDKATVTWVVDAPARLTVVANGVRTDSATANGRTRWRWEETHPIPTYVMVIAAAEMRRSSIPDLRCGTIADGPTRLEPRAAGGDSTCVVQAVYRSPDVARVPAAFAEAPAIVAFYSALVAPFPYERLDHLQSSTRFGGMENATAIFYADGTFRQGTMSVALIAHETAHQWFGDAVTERRWAELWLSEGFATYFALVYAEHSRGADSLAAGMRAMRAHLLADPVVARRPVIDTLERDPLALLDANSYQKGGFVLHMARRLVGDSAFVQGVRAYWLAHRDGNASSDDLRAALEKSAGRDLRWFFDQWLRRPGYPELGVEWSYDRARRRVYLEIAQRPRFGSFRFPLVVEVTRADGGVVRATVEVPARDHARLELPLDLAAAPTLVRVDPDADLLAAIDTAQRR